MKRFCFCCLLARLLWVYIRNLNTGSKFLYNCYCLWRAGRIEILISNLLCSTLYIFHREKTNLQSQLCYSHMYLYPKAVSEKQNSAPAPDVLQSWSGSSSAALIPERSWFRPPRKGPNSGPHGKALIPAPHGKALIPAPTERYLHTYALRTPTKKTLMTVLESIFLSLSACVQQE